MITYKTNRLLTFLGAAVLSLTVNFTPAFAGSGIVLVQRMGTVEIKGSQPNAWKTVASGTVLSFGDVIRTGHKSKAEISFESGIIRMHENTILEIPSRFQQIPVREGSEKLKNVFLSKGRSLFQVFKNGLQNGFEVTTPSIIAGVKGTTFTVSEEEGHRGVAVMEGTVVVTNRKFPKESMEIRSGHFIMLKDEHLAPAREFRDQNDLRIKEKRLKDVKEKRVKDVKDGKSLSHRKERLADLKNDAQDRTGTGGFTLPGKSGNLATGLNSPSHGNSGKGGGNGHGGGSSGSGSSGSGSSGSGSSGSN
jgi:uncharacterized membrane protein YgcG